jgi:hypothetical protein
MTSLAQTARLIEATAGDIARPRPQRLVHETFEAFRVKDSGEVFSDLRGNPTPIATADTLKECADAATIQCSHKAQFVIRHTDQRTGEVVLHIFQVRQKATPTYVYSDYQTRRVQPLYSEKVASVRVDRLGAGA